MGQLSIADWVRFSLPLPVWTFSENGEVEATETLLGKAPEDDDRATWRLRGSDVLIDWAGVEDWTTFHFPIEAARTVGDSWRGAGLVRATKRR